MPDIRSARSVGAQQLPGQPAGFRRSACALRAAPAHNRRRKPHGISAPRVNPHALHWSPGAGDLTCTFAAATTLCQRSSHNRARSLPDSACRVCHTIHEAPRRRDDANAPSFDGRFTHHRPKGAGSWSAWMPPLTRFRSLSITASSFAAYSACEVGPDLASRGSALARMSARWRPPCQSCGEEATVGAPRSVSWTVSP